MHLRCVFPSVNSVLYLLIICLVSQTNLAKDKEYIPEFDNLSIIDSDLDKSDQDELAGADGPESDQWVRESSSSLTIGNLGYDRISPKFSSAEEVVDHVIASGVIENLETEELDRISKKYNSHLEEEREPSQASHHRIRWSQSSKILHQLLEIYKSKSSGVLAKRGEGGPQLSIVNPLDVLRQRLLLELARRRMKENQDQIQANAEILKKIGKRSISSNDIIPEQPVRHSSGDITETVIKTNNKLISDSTTTRKFVSFNTNLNKSLNKCQKCKRKKMFQQIFLANKCKIMYKC